MPIASVTPASANSLLSNDPVSCVDLQTGQLHVDSDCLDPEQVLWRRCDRMAQEAVRNVRVQANDLSASRVRLTPENRDRYDGRLDCRKVAQATYRQTFRRDLRFESAAS